MRAVLVCSVVVSVAWEVGNLLIPVYCASVKLSPSDIGWVLGSFSAVLCRTASDAVPDAAHERVDHDCAYASDFGLGFCSLSVL